MKSLFQFIAAVWVLPLLLLSVFGCNEKTERLIEKGLPTRFHIERDYCDGGLWETNYCVIIVTDTFTGCKTAALVKPNEGAALAVFDIKPKTTKCKE